MRITCLHTHPLSVPEYESAALPSMHLTHHIRRDLAQRARLMSGDCTGIAIETNVHVRKLTPGADVVLVTCPLLSQVTLSPGVSANQLLGSAIEGLQGDIEILHAMPNAEPCLRQALTRKSGQGEVRFLALPVDLQALDAGQDQEAAFFLADAIAKSSADHILVMHVPVPQALQSDPRVRTAATLALTRLNDLLPVA